MDLETFLEHVGSQESPDPQWPAAVRALWFAEKGDWASAHKVTQEDKGPAGAWVHANLHREEGDISNARYWYARCGEQVPDTDIAAERHTIATVLLKGI